jgi:hypothetical protein
MTTDPVTVKPDLYTALLEQAAFLRAQSESKPPQTDPRSPVDSASGKPAKPDSFALTLTSQTRSDARHLANESRQTDDYTKLVTQNRLRGSIELKPAQPSVEPSDPAESPARDEATAAPAAASLQSTFLEVQTILVGEDDPAGVSRHPFIRFAARLYQNVSRYRPTGIDAIGSTLNAIA